MLSAIQLLSHSFSKIELNATDAENPDGELNGSHVLSTQKSESEEHVWLAKLSVEFHNADETNPAPYKGSFEIIGRFQLHPEFPAESSEKMIAMNTGAILYGAVREMIISLTSRSLHGSVQIPTIDARSFIPKEDKPSE
ncbi:hypothetical protein [Rubritalea profundi]|uniref:Preprotein translocase subunit SecB n=1 Tax=Rubritalea profundi TaxID=1658618 RepID=A0A2S7U5P8_9BACT|nr:hypothetical protein [Rubritalea profundi]PQJ29652.1 hypothetical protein BSZ32_14910 [Rubritalea profundi]